jgi:hypothetical protein
MPLRHLGYIELPPSRSDIGFDHADIHAATDRLYVAHTSKDTIDVIDVIHDRYRNGTWRAHSGHRSEATQALCVSASIPSLRRIF